MIGIPLSDDSGQGITSMVTITQFSEDMKMGMLFPHEVPITLSFEVVELDPICEVSIIPLFDEYPVRECLVDIIPLFDDITPEMLWLVPVISPLDDIYLLLRIHEFSFQSSLVHELIQISHELSSSVEVDLMSVFEHQILDINWM